MASGSLTNMFKSNNASQIPAVGMGCTHLMWSDRHAYTVISVSKSGRVCQIRSDKEIRTDVGGMTECQTYSFEPDPDGSVKSISLRKDGRWREVGHGSGGSVFVIGHRESYHDYSF